jgi:hypothetical protein
LWFPAGLKNFKYGFCGVNDDEGALLRKSYFLVVEKSKHVLGLKVTFSAGEFIQS